MPGANWQRWGEDDERGALNLIDADRIIAATGLVRRGVAISLAQPLDETTPVSLGRPSLAHYMKRDGGDYAAGARCLGRSRFSDDVIVMGTHTGTHVDALCHVWYGTELYNGFSERTLRSRGAGRCGIEKAGPVVSRGVLLDVARELQPAPLEAGFEITAEHLRACCSSQGARLAAGDVVLIRTGWLAGAGHEPERYFAGEPGIGLDAARWLADQDVAVVGADNYAVESLFRDSEGGFPVHELLLRDHGVLLIEGLALDSLAETSVSEFLFVAAALPIRGGTASPVAPIAVL